ncbi:MAG: hypothetical protein AAGK17_04200 [Pseudomonadota bacterium]
MLNALNILAIMALAGASTPQEAPLPTLCETGEKTILYGQVQDDFGFDVAACLSGEGEDQRLTIRWVGEGGGSDISCTADDCDGRIEYSRFTSPHLTILTLGWIKDGKKQTLIQQFSRDDMDSKPEFSTSHRWYPAELSWIRVQAQGHVAYPVRTSNDPLALMAVESILSARPGSHPLFGEAQ